MSTDTNPSLSFDPTDLIKKLDTENKIEGTKLIIKGGDTKGPEFVDEKNTLGYMLKNGNRKERRLAISQIKRIQKHANSHSM